MIGVVYGGDSLEHEVSIKSGKAAVSALDCREFYQKKDGTWEVDGEEVLDVIPHLKACEVIIPLCHGSPGEDGTLQGFLQIHNILFAGCDVASSAVCMDKDFTKRILESHGIKTTPSRTFYSLEEALDGKITLPVVVKTTSLGSTFGVYKVTGDPKDALTKAFDLGEKVLVEKLIEGRELWCSVLEKDGELIISSPCEIVPISGSGFHTYESKYNTESKTVYHLPAKDVDKAEIKEIARKVFITLGCSGMVRIDLFQTEDKEILVNEVNSIPGFTPTSLYPRALIHDGLTYEEIILALIDTAKAKGSKNGFRNLSSSSKKRVSVKV